MDQLTLFNIDNKDKKNDLVLGIDCLCCDGLKCCHYDELENNFHCCICGVFFDNSNDIDFWVYDLVKVRNGIIYSARSNIVKKLIIDFHNLGDCLVCSNDYPRSLFNGTYQGYFNFSKDTKELICHFLNNLPYYLVLGKYNK